MRRLIHVSITVAVISAIASGSVWAALAKSGYILRDSLQSNTGASMTESRRTYWKGDSLRIEVYTVAGQLVQIKRGNTLYRYDPVAKVGERLSSKDLPTVQQMLAKEVQVPKGLKKVGKARVAGQDCDVYSPAKKDSKVKSDKLYISTDSRLPLMMKRELISGPRRLLEEVRKIEINPRIPDSMFQIPKGVKVVEAKTKAPAGTGAPKGRK